MGKRSKSIPNEDLESGAVGLPISDPNPQVRSSLQPPHQHQVQVASMGFTSFAGRVLFASIFILSAWQEFNEFGHDGGHASKVWRPKFSVFKGHVSTHVGIQVPEIEIKHLVAAAIALKGVGGILFIFGSTLGAYLLALQLFISTPILYDFYNYDVEKPEFVNLFVKFTQNLALFGALLFFVGMKNSMPKRQPKKKATKPKTM